MSAFEVWSLLRRRWWVIALAAAAAAVGALLYSLFQTPLYRARADVAVLPSRAGLGLKDYLEARMGVFRALLLTLPEAEADLPDDLVGRMYVRVLPEENRLIIEVDDPLPQRASDLAALLAARLKERETALNRELAGVDPVYVQLLAPIQVPKSPASPRYLLNVLAGLFLGAVVGLPLAFGWDFFDDRVGDPHRAALRLGMAVWPALPPFPPAEVPLLPDPEGDVAAAFHRLHTYLRLAWAERSAGRPSWHTLAVVGVTAQDLPPALPANLGTAMAQEGQPTLLVDADFSRPALHQLFGRPAEIGLGHFLRQEEGAIAPIPTGQPDLSLLPAGTALSPAARTVALQRLARILPALAEKAATVILHLPSPQDAPEGLLLASVADAVLLVGRAGRTRGREVRRLRETLDDLQVPVLGLALWRERKSR